MTRMLMNGLLMMVKKNSPQEAKMQTQMEKKKRTMTQKTPKAKMTQELEERKDVNLGPKMTL